MSSAASSTLFEKIAAGQIPSSKVYEDEVVFAFNDISPCAKTHILVVPKVCGRLTQLQKAEEADRGTLGHLLWACGHVAKLAGLEKGYRIVLNDGPLGCQSVYHLHAHIIGGEQLTWPPGVAGKAEVKKKEVVEASERDAAGTMVGAGAGKTAAAAAAAAMVGRKKWRGRAGRTARYTRKRLMLRLDERR